MMRLRLTAPIARMNAGEQGDDESIAGQRRIERQQGQKGEQERDQRDARRQAKKTLPRVSSVGPIGGSNEAVIASPPGTVLPAGTPGSRPSACRSTSRTAMVERLRGAQAEHMAQQGRAETRGRAYRSADDDGRDEGARSSRCRR